MDGNANDESRNGYHGVAGSKVTYDSGRIGLVAKFDGSKDSYIEIEDRLNMGTDEFTISAWIMADNYAQTAKIINKGQAGVGNPPQVGYSLRFLNLSEDKALRFDIVDHSRADDPINRDTIAKIPSNELPINEFLLITGVLRRSSGNGANLDLYVNGELKSSTHTTELTSLDTDLSFAIGALKRTPSYDASEVFNGLIDDVRIYNRPLSKSEIQTLYVAGQRGSP
ncbi:MAG: hypothetical protein GWN13_28530 [Phycisphaerae bacterium]|nr:hypothetical protein [Phycisphaerae bacterium]